MQGSAATDLRQGVRFYFTFFCSSSRNAKVKEILKPVYIHQNYCKDKSYTFLKTTTYKIKTLIMPATI